MVERHCLEWSQAALQEWTGLHWSICSFPMIAQMASRAEEAVAQHETVAAEALFSLVEEPLRSLAADSGPGGWVVS